MGKNLTSQKRGKGSSRYRAPSFRYPGKVKHRSYDKDLAVGKVKDIIHSPAHYAPLAVVAFEDKKQTLMISPEGLKVGEKVEIGEKAKVDAGNILPLNRIPDGTAVYNIEGAPGDGGKFVRSSGGFARVTGKTQKGVSILLPSKKQRLFNPMCRAAIGIVAGSGRKEKPLLKAGKAHHKKKARNKLYPITSSTSMNAVDHPFGGSRSSKKGIPTASGKHAPPGAKVGSISPRRSGKRK
ncbi:50S ribosomal protein L2 [Candidatus Woesearchaeota archaeon]|nr:50S ribosomal protein L2 [Candidatus Woesearchaeota archaeon]